jgi:hypothetical protein
MSEIANEDPKTVLHLFCEFNGIEVPEEIENDVIAVDIDGIPELWISYLGDGEVEVYAEIEGIDITDPGILRLLLEANFMGMATEAARLSINPVVDLVVLSERWDFERLLAEDALADLARFARLVASWRSEGVATLKSKKNGDEDFPSEEPQDVTILRL